MTEAFKKRNFIFITTAALFLLGILLASTSEAKKAVKRRNELTRNGNKRKFQTRSSLCFEAQIKEGVDNAAAMRFHRDTQKCYRVGDRGPCGEMMIFVAESSNSEYGSCDCDVSLRCGRPLIFWPSTNRCYHVHDQGPCREGKWLVFGFDLHPVCRRNPCLLQENQQPSYDSRYWFSYKSNCYRTYTKGYCAEGEILFTQRSHFRPTCVKNPECGTRPFNLVQTCLPGQRLDFYGKCSREFEPLNNKNNRTDLTIPVTERPTNLYCLFCKH